MPIVSQNTILSTVSNHHNNHQNNNEKIKQFWNQLDIKHTVINNKWVPWLALGLSPLGIHKTPNKVSQCICSFEYDEMTEKENIMRQSILNEQSDMFTIIRNHAGDAMLLLQLILLMKQAPKSTILIVSILVLFNIISTKYFLS